MKAAEDLVALTMFATPEIKVTTKSLGRCTSSSEVFRLMRVLHTSASWIF